EDDVLFVCSQINALSERSNGLRQREAGIVGAVELGVRQVLRTRNGTFNAHDRALGLTKELRFRTPVDQGHAFGESGFHVSSGGTVFRTDIDRERGRDRNGSFSNALATGSVILAPATIENGDSVVAEILEGPVNAGGTAEF